MTITGGVLADNPTSTQRENGDCSGIMEGYPPASGSGITFELLEVPCHASRTFSRIASVLCLSRASVWSHGIATPSSLWQSSCLHPAAPRFSILRYPSRPYSGHPDRWRQRYVPPNKATTLRACGWRSISGADAHRRESNDPSVLRMECIAQSADARAALHIHIRYSVLQTWGRLGAHEPSMGVAPRMERKRFSGAKHRTRDDSVNFMARTRRHIRAHALEGALHPAWIAGAVGGRRSTGAGAEHEGRSG